MYTTCTFEEAKQKVAELCQAEPSLSVTDIATRLSLSEAEASLALPEEMVTAIAGENAELILSQLPEWGNVTTITNSFGSIFEFKGPFPKGKTAHGYYNIMGKAGLHGHLKLDLITDIAFVSKLFHGTETHHIAFFNQDGNCVFRVYLGRDKARNLIPEQIEAFNTLKLSMTK
ncbi:heme utilization cystosolic carrier protein HutX [Vibrio astriarenae]|uniref:Heme utilization cystosolic carrier protein HutX n=1 Tax=Vibrio astriarenae TaxID=1481923 RepID=A0A7Z2YE45_9VIBR|nr:heme utilization cystosolic carrier protein HutX [Vibrio astriarenae]QIA63695.1 heme utilization cystosolic carrier protein HutX [Vibrio astriarenae]